MNSPRRQLRESTPAASRLAPCSSRVEEPGAPEAAARPPFAERSRREAGLQLVSEGALRTTKLLAIGTDATWLHDLVAAATAAGCEVRVCVSVCDAFEAAVGASAPSPTLVLVDADCCDERTGPALRALRVRLQVPFIVVHGPASERIARTLTADALAAKTVAGETLRQHVLRHRHR